MSLATSQSGWAEVQNIRLHSKKSSQSAFGRVRDLSLKTDKIIFSLVRSDATICAVRRGLVLDRKQKNSTLRAGPHFIRLSISKAPQIHLGPHLGLTVGLLFGCSNEQNRGQESCLPHRLNHSCQLRSVLTNFLECKLTVSISIKGRASAFGVLMLLSLLSACAMFEAATNQNYYTWDGPPSVPIRQYEWQTGSAEEVQQRCSFKYEIAAGCTIRLYGHPNGPTCIIISTVTESEAHRHHTLSPTGTPMESHWHHEVVEHCFNGKNHRSS